jgi:RNA polymerase sigma factor (sigma-70 family)
MAMALSVAPISSDGSDVDLVAAVRRGSDAAFEELYSRYSHRIGAYVRSMVGDHGRAEDITQEIFIAALRRMRDTERPIAFKPWIYEIAKNACIDSFRRTRRAQEISLDADDGLSPADRGRLTVVTTPDSALDSKQALDDLRGAFGGLSHNHHEILVLRELEGRSYNDIGERLGMSRPVVESTLFRARRRLAEEYDELASGRRCAFVRKMVDSGPQYSLGLRDRRRIARHLSHCQPCRGYARIGGFDESILAIPRVASKIAALLPIPLLRARWGAFNDPGAHRGRPSLLAWRSVHALARSSDVLVVAAPSASRGAATAAAIVLAGVGGGIVTLSSDTGAPQPNVVHALAPGTAIPAVARANGSQLRIDRGLNGAPGARGTSATRVRAVDPGHSHAALGAAASGAAGIGSASQPPVGSPATDPGSGTPGAPSTSKSPSDAAPASGPGGASQSVTGGGGGGSKAGSGSNTSTAGSGSGAGTAKGGNAGTTSNAGGTGTAKTVSSSKGSTPPVKAHGAPKATKTATSGTTIGTATTATPPPSTGTAATTGSSSTTSSTTTTTTATATVVAQTSSGPHKNTNVAANAQ